MAQERYDVVMVPPEGEPTTFPYELVGDDGTVEEIERQKLRSITVFASSEDAAKHIANSQAFDLAAQEVDQAGEFALDKEGVEPPGKIDAVIAKQWVVDSVEKVEE